MLIFCRCCLCAVVLYCASAFASDYQKLQQIVDQGAIVTSSSLRAISQWDIATGARISFRPFVKLTSDNVGVFGGEIVLAHDGSTYFVQDEFRGSTSIYNGKDNKVISVLQNTKGAWISYSRDSNHLIVIDHRSVTIYAARSGSRVGQFLATNEPRVGSVSPSGRLLALGEKDGVIEIFDFSNPDSHRTLDGSRNAHVGFQGFFEIEFTATDKVVALRENGDVLVYDETSTQPVAVVETNFERPDYRDKYVAMAPNGQYMVVPGPAGHMIAVDFSKERTYGYTLDTSLENFETVIWSPDSRQFAVADRAGRIELWTSGWTRSWSSSGQVSSGAVTDLRFMSGTDWLASAGADSTIRLWNLKDGTQAVRLIDLGDDGWISLTQAGYFRSSGRSVENALNVRLGANVFGIGNFRERFSRPDLVEAALAGNQIGTAQEILHSKPPPSLALDNIPQMSSDRNLRVNVTLTDTGGGFGIVRAYLEDTAVAESQPGPDPATRIINIKLAAGSNQLTFVAFNADNSVHGDPVSAIVHTSFSTDEKPRLFALVIGIASFDNPELSLVNPAMDATDLAQFFRNNKAGLFRSVDIKLLDTRESTTKQEIEDALGQYASIDPGDVFVLYIASHGTIIGQSAESRKYYILGSGAGVLTPDGIARESLSQDEIRSAIASIPTKKKLLLFDACNAGALGEALQVRTRGLGVDTAVENLSSAVGVSIITAATAEQEALEGYQGHGLFTWVVLQALSGKADYTHKGYVSTTDIGNFVLTEVPRLSEQAFQQKQFANFHNTGQDFPVTKLP